jgi:hypothetical protein
MSCFSMQLARRTAGLAIGFFAVNAFAQTSHHPSGTAETTRTATTLAAPPAASGLRYESVFARYKSYRDEKTGSWLGANETVDRIGGWRAYAREAQQPAAAAPPVTSATAAPGGPAKPDPHAGHGRKP